MKLSNESRNEINQIISALIERYSAGGEESIVTDIHFQPDFSSGAMVVSDDDDQILSEVVISEFEGLNDRDGYREAAFTLRRALDSRRKELENLGIMKPYSFVLVDEEKETVEDIFLVDDDLIIAEEGLLAGLDDDLNDFLKNLLKD